MVLDWIKFLKKLNKKDQITIFDSIYKIKNLDFKFLDIKSISGKKGYFRCREGNIRIIFLINNREIIIKKVGNRGDVYKWLKNI